MCTLLFMSTRVRLLVLLALAYLAAPVGASAAGFTDVRVQAPGGADLRDAQGRRLQLRGVNVVPKCAGAAVPAKAPGAPCVGRGDGPFPSYVVTSDSTDPGRRFSAADAEQLRAMGFSAVRLGLIWEGLEPGPADAKVNDPRWCAPHAAGTPFPDLGADDPYDQKTVDRYLDRVAETVRLIRQAGMLVLLDMHQDAYGSAFGVPDSATPWQGEGAPVWATCTNGFPFGKPAKWQQAYFDTAVGAALDHFFSNDVVGDLQGQYAKVWGQVAKRFANEPAVIGYELFNEPTEVSSLTPPEFDRKLQCLYAGRTAAPASCTATAPPVQAHDEGLIGTIQAADRDAVVWYEPSLLSQFGVPETIGIGEGLPFGNLVLAFHVYGVQTLTSGFECTDPACEDSERRTIATLAKERAQTRTRQASGPAWSMTEFGAEDQVPDVAAVARLADERGLSWFYWSALQLHDPTGGPGESLIDDDTRIPKAAKARVLTRAYPFATAGTVTAQAFDPATGRFALTYAVDPAVDAPTLVVLPAAVYGTGVRLDLDGATASREGDLLLLRAQRGAREVRVVATPDPSAAAATAPGTRCAAARIRFALRRGERAALVRVRVGGRTVRTLRPRTRRGTVTVRRGRRAATARVRITAVTRSGARRTFVLRRRVGACAAA